MLAKALHNLMLDNDLLEGRSTILFDYFPECG
jgi:hypothetical protein